MFIFSKTRQQRQNHKEETRHFEIDFFRIKSKVSVTGSQNGPFQIIEDLGMRHHIHNIGLPLIVQNLALNLNPLKMTSRFLEAFSAVDHSLERLDMIYY